jgi:thioredoxin:protein disulfide reductase
MIKVDVTKGGDPLHERLLSAIRRQGVPTIVFLDARGEERTDLRLVDFLPPEPFLSRMADLKKPVTAQ